MTTLQKDAIELIQRMSEEKLLAIIQIMRLFDNSNSFLELTNEKAAAFETLEKLRRPIPELDEKKELAEWRDEKYLNENID